MGCFVSIIVFFLFLTLWSSMGTFKFFFFFLVLPYIIYRVAKFYAIKDNQEKERIREEKERIYKEKLRDLGTDEDEKEKIREYFAHQRKMENEKKEQEIKNSIIRKEKGEAKYESGIVKYIGGHEKLTKEVEGVLYIYDEEIRLYDFSLESGALFRIPLKNIKNITHDLSENLSVTKAVLFGIYSLAMKKKTYFLIIEYISDNGINNEMIFDLGKVKMQNFVNELNVARNSIKPETKGEDFLMLEKDRSSLNMIKGLAELKKKGILTEEEFDRKKADILDRI